MPSSIFQKIRTNYLFNDLKSQLLSGLTQEQELMNIFYRGLRPRVFRDEDPADMIIAAEDQFVDELIWILSGDVGIGFSRVSHFKSDVSPYQFCMVQKGGQVLLDFYVLHRLTSNFIYRALTDVTVFALDNKYIQRMIFANKRFDSHCI